MLQELLNIGLVEIGPDDSRFEKVELASKALVETFKTDPSLLVPATLIAIDGDAREDEPIFSLVEDLTIEHWKTLRNTHVNRPRSIYRAIILHAIEAVTSGNPETSGVVWHTAVSPVNHQQARLGKEADLVKSLLYRLGNVVESEAVVRAGMVEPSAKRRSTKKPKDKAGFRLQSWQELKDAELVQDVARAAGPQYPQGTGLPNPNSFWPNSADQWSYQFTPRMTAALVKAVNLGVARLSESIAFSAEQYGNELELRITDQLDSVEELRQTLAAFNRSGRVRLDVLWWSEAKYSPSLNCGYRELPSVVVPLVMAHDLSKLVPPMAPASVTYLLGEAVGSLSSPRAEEQRIEVEDFLGLLMAHGTDVRNLFSSQPSDHGRMPLLDAVIQAAAGNEVGPEDLRLRTGVNPSLGLTNREFSMWVFRDLQARKLVEGLK